MNDLKIENQITVNKNLHLRVFRIVFIDHLKNLQFFLISIVSKFIDEEISINNEIQND